MIQEPGSRAEPALHRLHNCGPVAREVFRTPAIGRVLTFDLRRALLGWAPVRGDLDIEAEWPDPLGDAPPALIARVAAAVLADRGGEPPVHRTGTDADHARRCLAVLVEHLAHRGRLRRLAGIASHARRAASPPAATERPVSTNTLALTLAVYAVYAPPLLVWSRTPSLRWFHGPLMIRLRRLAAPGGCGRRT
jgi:hypothetical protein